MITVHFWSLRRLRAAQAIELPYEIPWRIVTAEMAEAEAAAAPDTWSEVHDFFKGWGWHNAHRRISLSMGELSWLGQYLRDNGREVPAWNLPMSDEQLNLLYPLFTECRAEWAAKQPPRPRPNFTKFSIPRIANMPAMPDLRAILSVQPLRIEP